MGSQEERGESRSEEQQSEGTGWQVHVDDDDILDALVEMDEEPDPEVDDTVEEDYWKLPESTSVEIQPGDVDRAPTRPNIKCPIAPSQDELDEHCRRGHV